MKSFSELGDFSEEKRDSAPIQAFYSTGALVETKNDSEAKLPEPAPLKTEQTLLFQAASEFNHWIKNLPTTHRPLALWLKGNSGLELIKKHIFKDNFLDFINILKSALEKDGYVGFIKAIEQAKIPFSEEQLWELRYQTNASLPNRYDIQKISPKAKYFVSVCKIGIHSYVMAGCDDSGDDRSIGRRYVFSGVGKVGDDKATGTLCNLLFSGYPAVFSDEQILKTKEEKKYGSSTVEVQYRAYELSYQQYVEYTRLLKRIPDSGEYNYYLAYAPLDQDGLMTNRYAVASTDAKQIFIQPSGQEQSCQSEGKELGSLTKLSLGNTCRHSALNFLRMLNVKDKQISSFWGTSLPNRMKMSGGKIISPLFIVPIPPELSIKKANPFLYKILKQVYEEIIRLSQTNYGIDLARRKVNALGELYKQLHKTKIDKDSHHIQAVLQAWKEQELVEGGSCNADLIKESRGHYFRWSLFHSKKTTSAKLIEKLDQVVDKKCALRRDSR